MAHYAEIVEDKVVRVLITNNDWTHEETLDWLKNNLSNNEFIQTSYNAKIRGKFAGIGDTYNRELDIFVAPINDKEILILG